MAGPDLLVQSILVACVAAIGASIGSFLNVCIYRIPIGLTVTQPRRSFCPSCRTQIRATDNIPVVSWLLLRGRCRSCHAPIPVWYFLVELFAGAGAGLAYLKSGLLGAALFLAVYSLLAYALRTRRTGHGIGAVFLSALAALVASLIFQRQPDLLSHFWKIAIGGLGGLLMIRAGYPETKQAFGVVIFLAALAGGWLGSLLAGGCLLVLRGRSFKTIPDVEDAIAIAFVSLGPLLS
ncbi:MAG: prepilin peptidase [Verrucomicrobia bacterium]|nr:prepilin peptidase [Verrucomicrobiota bacterium]MBV8273698.1 prepilin peptidase [Verrucomicrobiota bacterium]